MGDVLSIYTCSLTYVSKEKTLDHILAVIEPSTCSCVISWMKQRI